MNIVIDTLRSMCNAILFSPSVFILLGMLIVLYFKNKKTVSIQKIMVRDSVESAIELTLSQFVFGVFGGIIGSLILNLCGIIFNENCRIEILILTSIILMLIKPSLVCFSYSASLLGAVSIISKICGIIYSNINYTTFNLDILYIMIFVGVMHLVEGILVFLDGHRGAVPIFIEKENEVLEGYSLKRYWVLPLSVIIISNGNELSYGLNIISFLPIYTFMGYSAVTYTKTKRKKAISSGINIFIYGISLIIVAQVARIGLIGEIFVVIFAPVSHELMMNIQRNKEIKKQYKKYQRTDSMRIKEKSFKDILDNINKNNK